MAIFRVRARGAAKEVALGAVLVPAGDRRTAGRLVRAVARAPPTPTTCSPSAATGSVRVVSCGCRGWDRSSPTARVTAVAPPAAWDLTLGDIELF